MVWIIILVGLSSVLICGFNKTETSDASQSELFDLPFLLSFVFFLKESIYSSCSEN